jgi:hypothetical protein
MDKLKELFDDKESNGNKFRSLVEEFENKLSNELKELEGIVSEKVISFINIVFIYANLF